MFINMIVREVESQEEVDVVALDNDVIAEFVEYLEEFYGVNDSLYGDELFNGGLTTKELYGYTVEFTLLKGGNLPCDSYDRELIRDYALLMTGTPFEYLEHGADVAMHIG